VFALAKKVLGILVLLCKIDLSKTGEGYGQTENDKKNLSDHSDVIQPGYFLLPLNGSRRLRTDVVDYAIDTLHFINDITGHFGQKLVRQMRPVSRHSIGTGHGAQTYNPFIGPLVAHNSNGLKGGQYCACLPNFII